MKQIQPGTQVRAKSNHSVSGAFLGLSCNCDNLRLFKVDTTWGRAHINDDEIEVVPPEPFDTTKLGRGDLVQLLQPAATYPFIVCDPTGWDALSILCVWKRRGNDYVMVYDADQGGYLEPRAS